MDSRVLQQIKELKCLIDDVIKKIGKSCPECVGKLYLSVEGNYLTLNHENREISSVLLPSNVLNLEFRVQDGMLQYKIDNESWVNLFDLSSLNGREVEMSVEGGFIVWKYVGDSAWINLISLSDLKGDDGKSAYDIWIEEGNIGSQQDFLDSLKGDTTHTYCFDSPSETWMVPHNLNKKPIINIMVDNKLVHSSIFYIDLDTLIVNHSKPQIGCVEII